MTARTLALATALAGALTACSRAPEKASLPDAGAGARAVRVGKPTTRLETGLARATGVVRARQEAVLAAKGTGQVKRILVEVGDRVRAGQPLVELDPAMASLAVENGRAAVKLAEATLSAAERDLKRGELLNSQQALADAGLDRVRTGHDLAAAQLDQARAALHMAEQQLRDTVLLAPFDGVVTGRYRNAGDSVSAVPVSPVVAVTDVDHLEARLAVPEGIEAFVVPGQKVSGVTTPGGRRFEATVRLKNAVVEAASRTVEVLVDVGPAAGAALRPGTLVNVDFSGFGNQDGLYLPTNAVLADAKGSYVLVVAAGKAERRTIRPVQVNPGVVAVQGGLDPSAAVILDPGSLAEGEAVVPLVD
jgi:RND family efflux transporter MFP subunit